MNKPYTIIFFGFLAVMMGIGKDTSQLIPSEFKLIFGVLLIGYGIYTIYKRSHEKAEIKTPIDKKAIKRVSYIYLAIGVLLLKSPDFFDPRNPYELNLFKVLIYILGFGFIIYGLNKFFKEKRDKHESGSIEQRQ